MNKNGKSEDSPKKDISFVVGVGRSAGCTQNINFNRVSNNHRNVTRSIYWIPWLGWLAGWLPIWNWNLCSEFSLVPNDNRQGGVSYRRNILICNLNWILFEGDGNRSSSRGLY